MYGTSGTALLPSWSFSADQTSGFYLSAVGKVGVTGNGVAVAFFDENQVGTTDNQFYYANGAVPCPVGSIQDWPGTSAPTGWLLLYGQVVAQATYPGLYAVCGTTYNTGGEGAGNFRLPDCRGSFTAGKDNMGGSTKGNLTLAGSGVVGTTLGATGGSQNQTISTNQIPAHTHTGTTASGGVNHTHSVSGTTDSSGVHSHSVTDPGHAHQYDNKGNTVAQSGAGVTVSPVNSGNVTTTEVTHISIDSAGAHTHTFSVTSGNASAFAHTHTFTTDANTTTGSPLTTVPPVIIFNKIIFAGR